MLCVLLWCGVVVGNWVVDWVFFGGGAFLGWVFLRWDQKLVLVCMVNSYVLFHTVVLLLDVTYEGSFVCVGVLLCLV